MNQDLQLVFNKDNEVYTTSLIVAKVFEKEHRNILRDIENLACSIGFRQLNFEQSYYINEQNREMPMMKIHRDGVSLLVMGFTGEKAMIWKEKYIKAFNEMEETIRKQLQPDLSNLDILVNVAIQLRDQEKLIKQQEKKLKEIENIQQEAIDTLEDIPISEDKPKDITTRKAITMLVRNYAIRKIVSIKECWDNLYYQFKYRYGFDVEQRYKNAGGKKSKIDIIESNGKIKDLFDLASEMFK